MGKLNAVSCWAFLRQLNRSARRPGRRVIVILDNAAFHHARLHQAWRQRREPGLAMLFLPPYSPELNPIERVWKLTRRQCLHNRHFPTLDAVVDAAEGTFDEWSCGSDVLRRLCALI
jgi:transposase